MPTFDLSNLLNPKFWLYLVLAVALGWCGYKGYNWIWDRGYDKHAQETAAEITRLTGERDTAVTNYNAYKTEYDEWVRTTKKAQEQYLREQLADLAARQARLDQAEADFRKKPATIKEVIKYVPVEVDASYRLPVGLVRLYGETLQGSPAQPGSHSGADVPQGNAIDVGEASGLAVSQFGLIAAQNNAECVLRGKVIEEWQGWYVKNESFFNQLVEWQKKNGPTPVSLTPPPAEEKK